MPSWTSDLFVSLAFVSGLAAGCGNSAQAGSGAAGPPRDRKIMRTVSPPHPALSPEALAEIYAHARREHPNESCGIVYGRKAQPVAARAVACVNIQNELHAEDPVKYTRDARTAYNLGPGDLFTLAKSLRSAEPAKIVYHSHVDVNRADGAYFSDTDQAGAQMDGEPTYPIEYVVVDIRRDGVRGAAQFAWDASARRYVEIGRYAGPGGGKVTNTVSDGGGSTFGARPGGSRKQSPAAEEPRQAATREENIRKAYSALEAPPGSDLKRVRDSYQRLMRKYDPDLYIGSPDKHRVAIELTRRLTDAYEFLEKQLRR
jgi:proteasome lid subunit RPN8/RPN11